MIVDIHIWDIMSELVKLCTYPSPMNPFEVDFDYFPSLSIQDQVIATAAMVYCLQQIVLYTQDEKIYSGKGELFPFDNKSNSLSHYACN